MLRRCLSPILTLTLSLSFALTPMAFAQKGGKGDKGGNGGKGDSQPTFTFTWLGTLGGPFTSTSGINESGDVWGSSTVPSGVSEPAFASRPFIIWSTGPDAGQMVDFQQQLIDEGRIGEFDWENLVGVYQVEIGEINNSGGVACIIEEIIDPQSGEYLFYTCLYTPASVDDQGNVVASSLQYIDISSSRIDRVVLNDAGVVASDSNDNVVDGSTGTYQWTPESGRNYLGFWKETWSINLNGAMCGPYGNWKYIPGDGYSQVFPSDVGWDSSVREINDFNQIGGTYQRSNTSYKNACRVEADGSINVIKMPKNRASVGWAINNNGDVVGSGSLNGGWRPFVYTDNDGVIDVFSRTSNLPQELATLIDGNGISDRIGYFDINDSGVVIGRVLSGPNSAEAFLLAPNE
ncbi:hypothetical protein NZK35_09590 [Stieleria sp. ICT_E10.1]|uniref:hypothetical protein n=1 Tax=Stieleria sedimenti TaxID=2976331 RepID=UPI00217F5124|nr:hypothetical protein [Stieleria sedimenti]MCS7466896.1 hypothetical protein [Stieleria sedimenti]